MYSAVITACLLEIDYFDASKGLNLLVITDALLVSFKGKVKAKTPSSNKTCTNEKKIASHHPLLIQVPACIADAHALLIDDDSDDKGGRLS